MIDFVGLVQYSVTCESKVVLFFYIDLTMHEKSTHVICNKRAEISVLTFDPLSAKNFLSLIIRVHVHHVLRAYLYNFYKRLTRTERCSSTHTYRLKRKRYGLSIFITVCSQYSTV